MRQEHPTFGQSSSPFGNPDALSLAAPHPFSSPPRMSGPPGGSRAASSTARRDHLDTHPSRLAEEHTSPNVRYALQAIVDERGRMVASELLFRWNSRDGSVGPELGGYATSVALCNALLDGELLTAGHATGQPVGPIFVNMDESFLLSPMAEAVDARVGVIELLETLVITPAVRQRIQSLHQRGYRFALDDVQSLDDPRWTLAEHLEFVKIDVLQLGESTLQALVTMAHALGLRVVAEKVESDEQLARLRLMGIDRFQGYAVQRPQIQSPPALPGCDPVILGKATLLAQAGASNQAIALLVCSDPALMARLMRLQAVVAPSEVARSDTLMALMASLPRQVLVAWLLMMNVAAVHGRGRQRSLLVRRALIAYRAQLLEQAMNPASQEFARELFDHYVMLINVHMQPFRPAASAA